MNWLIIGGGVSGLGAAKFLKKQNNYVRVSEQGKLSPTQASTFTSLGVDLRDGGHDLDHLNNIEAIVMSPGLPASHLLLKAGRDRGLPIISEIDLALRDFKGRLVAITGTNGKSTTCAMLAHVLTQIGHRASIGGNFGDPPTALIAEDRMQDLFIAELSSYQLEQSELVSPVVAIFTSFSHDHLSRHGSMEGYLAAKWRIFARMTKSDLAILPSHVFEMAHQAGLSSIKSKTLLYYSDAASMRRLKMAGYYIKNETLHYQDGRQLSLAGLGIESWQNYVNAAFVIPAAAHLTGCSFDDIANSFKGFKGLPHRCEIIGRLNQRAVINDSKSTNVESTLIALAGQKEPVILMMGGKGKNEPYSPLVAEKSKIKALLTFGASGDEIAAALVAEVPVERFPTLKAALAKLLAVSDKYAAPILFSPGCASFDEFDNFEHRGQVFTAALRPYLDQ